MGFENPELVGLVDPSIGAALDAIPEGIAYFDAADRLVLWNRRYAAIWAHWDVALHPGVCFVALLRAGLAHGRYPEAKGRETDWLAQRLADRESAESTTERAGEGGSCLRIDERRTPDGGRVTTCIDITDLKHQEQEACEARAFLDAVIEAVPAMILVKDGRTGRFLIINRAGEEIIGSSRAEIIGKTDHEVMPADQAERILEADQQVLESGQLKVIEEEPIMTPHRGLRYFQTKKIALDVGDGVRHLLAIAEDITERKATAAALVLERERAQAANAAKTEFLANVSHEIRTPLNGIMGLTEGVLRTSLTAEQRELLAMVVNSARALNTLLNDVLDLSKVEAGQLSIVAEPFDLQQAITEAAGPFESVARQKGLAFRLNFAPDLQAAVVGDALRIRQIVANLANNAVKFTSQGEVSVDAYTAPTSDGGVVVHVTVKDTGPGFDDTVRAKLFERFQQGDGSVTRQFGGTGLGLSIAARLAALMGGTITCDARVGEGAAFAFAAPLACGRPSTVSSPIIVQSTLSTLGRPRVLLAEDHPTNQKVIQVLLGDSVDLRIVADGRAAVEAFQAGAFDLILMDTQMPEMDGLSAIRIIRSEEVRLGKPRTPIISLTASAMTQQVKDCLAAGADLHQAKPVTAEELFRSIEAALALTADGTINVASSTADE